MKRPTAVHGWAAVAGTVVVCDLVSEETLSSYFRRHRTHPLVILAFLGLSAHLFGAIPPKYDPLCLAFTLIGATNAQ